MRYKKPKIDPRTKRVERVKRSYRKTEYLSEIRTTIYLTKQQVDVLNKIIKMNKKRNKHKRQSKSRPVSVAQLIRTSINRCYVHPYLDYHVKGRKQKKGEEPD